MHRTNQSERLCRFGGWYRRTKRHRWRQLVEADSFGDAWTLLLDEMDFLPPGESLVSERDPNRHHQEDE